MAGAATDKQTIKEQAAGRRKYMKNNPLIEARDPAARQIHWGESLANDNCSQL
jgi:hypothetical protein